MTKQKITPNQNKNSKKIPAKKKAIKKTTAKKSAIKKTVKTTRKIDSQKQNPSSKIKKSTSSKKALKPVKRALIFRLLFNRYSVVTYVILLFILAFYLFYLNIVIIQKMSGRIWSLPSHVYARPLELYQGKSLSIAQLTLELEMLEFEKVTNRPTKPGQFRILNNKHFEVINRSFTYWDGKQKSQGVRFSVYQNQLSALSELYTDKTMPLFRMEPI